MIHADSSVDLPGAPAVFASPASRALLDRITRVAQSDANVLILGETGSGKEIAAKAVHAFSRRAARPWIDLNCAALPESLIESELFGYEKGAFSGAGASKPGLFELAHQGTLFLDEIGELPPHLQVKLLRILDGAPYFRVGGTRKITVSVRLIAATNRDLRAMIRQGEFREDLYFRLSQVALRVPPLRERAADIVPLAKFFLEQVHPGAELTPEAAARLEAHSWPGNVRELKNVITRAVIFAEDGRIGSDSIEIEPESLAQEQWTVHAGRKLEEVEKSTVIRTLETTAGHRQKAAEALGISRRTLTRRLKEYGMLRSRIA